MAGASLYAFAPNHHGDLQGLVEMKREHHCVVSNYRLINE
jgi:hypothetical protein